MPDATPLYGLPYPNNADTVKAAVKDIPKSLAQQLETTLSTFGGTPVAGSFIALVPSAGAESTAGGLRPLGYRKVGAGVELRGRIVFAGAVGAGTTLATLPVGYRPTGTVSLVQGAAATAGGYARVDVQAGGGIVLQDAIGAGGFVNLDGMEFTVDTGTPFVAVAGGTITGAGIPEGAVSAPVGTRYIDTAITRGAVEWLKITGTGNTGWRVVVGDSGIRTLVAWDAAGAVTAGALSPGSPFGPRPGVAGGVFCRRLNDQLWVWPRNVGAVTALTAGQTYDLVPLASMNPMGSQQSALGNGATTPFCQIKTDLTFAITVASAFAAGAAVFGGNNYMTTLMVATTGAPWPTVLP